MAKYVFNLGDRVELSQYFGGMGALKIGMLGTVLEKRAIGDSMEKHPEIEDYPFNERAYWLARADWHMRKAQEEEDAGYLLLANFRRTRAAYFKVRADDCEA